jgi:hypothetical protein
MGDKGSPCHILRYGFPLSKTRVLAVDSKTGIQSNQAGGNF